MLLGEERRGEGRGGKEEWRGRGGEGKRRGGEEKGGEEEGMGGSQWPVSPLCGVLTCDPHHAALVELQERPQ